MDETIYLYLVIFLFGFNSVLSIDTVPSPDVVFGFPEMIVKPDYLVCPYTDVDAYAIVDYLVASILPIPEVVWFRTELVINAKEPFDIKYINLPEKPFKVGYSYVLIVERGYYGPVYYYEHSIIVYPPNSGFLEIIYKTQGKDFSQVYYAAVGTAFEDFPATDSDVFGTLDPQFCR